MIHKHINGVDVIAEFSKDRKYRYRLEVIFKNKVGKNNKTACVVMQNPSYANEDVADKSVQVMEKVVFEEGLKEFKGVNRLIIVNQFSYIQTNQFKGYEQPSDRKNDLAIKEALKEADIVIIAWGKANKFVGRQNFVYNLLKPMKKKKIYKTSSHPSRMKYEGFIQPLKFRNFP